MTALARECRNRGIALRKSAFHLSRYRIGKHEHYRKIDVYNHDRKAFQDQTSRIVVYNAGYRPMQQIVADVQPNDCIVRRPDGTGQFTVKLIAFQDRGTKRIFPYFVQVNQGEGVRQEHVIEAFIALISDPEWGFPEQLLLDNGSEFAMFGKIADAIAMVRKDDADARTVINSQPYNASAKPIESTFAMLNRAVFSQMEGFSGGDRLNKKTHQVGRVTKPYVGSFEDFVAEAKKRIADFESWELKSGTFKGRSPAQVFADHVAAGWRPARVSPAAIDAAFCNLDSRIVRQGAISFGGESYTHPELPALNGRTISISIPWRRGADPLFKHLKHDWTYLERRMPHLPGDIAGAIDAGRMQAREVRSLRDMRREAGSIDLATNLDDRVRALPTRAAPAPLMDVLASSDAHALAAARIEAAERKAAAPSQAERRRARQNAETEELEKHYGIKRA